MALLGKLAEVRAELDAHRDDPWCKKVEQAVRGENAISTAALLDLLRAPATTGTARRLAVIMRSLHFIPIKSRRLMPGLLSLPQVESPVPRANRFRNGRCARSWC